MPLPRRTASHAPSPARRGRRALLAALIGLLAATSTAAPAAPPQRIASLVPSLTETVCALGACGRLVGIDRHSNWPPAVRALPKTGALEDASVEQVLGWKPDLVLASRPSRATERLRALGVPVLLLPVDRHAEMQRVIDTLAQRLGVPEAAPPLWRSLQRQLDEAAARVPAGWRGAAAYVEVDAGPYAAGRDSFIGETLARLGLGNVVPAALGPFPLLNPEFVVRAQPALVVAAQRSAGAMAQRPGWGALRALAERRVCAFDAEHFELLVRPGPRLGEAAALLADCVRALPPPASAR